MSLTRTPAELALETLRTMAVVDASEPALSSEDEAYLIGVYRDKFEELYDLKIAYWPRDEIPAAVFITLRDLLANEVRGAFGEPLSPDAKEANDLMITMKLRRHVERQKDGLRVQGEYF